jgi:hypothetical protein
MMLDVAEPVDVAVVEEVVEPGILILGFCAKAYLFGKVESTNLSTLLLLMGAPV